MGTDSEKAPPEKNIILHVECYHATEDGVY